MKFTQLLEIDRLLSTGGVPSLRGSPRWCDDLRTFYDNDFREHAGRLGRGASKSTNAAKCMTAEVLCDEWKVPRGERHWAINISENLDEARARLGQISEYLRILGVPFEPVGDQLLLSELPLGFWSRPARIGALSGPRVVAWSIDEAAKLNVEGVNPSRELAVSLRAASVTHVNARGRIYSSPWGPSGFHFDTIEAGTTKRTLVTQGATWEYAPWLTEARTRELEPDPRVWRREYAAIPQAAALAAFDTDAIDRAMLPRQPSELAQPALILDPSSGRSDAWTWSVVRWAKDGRGHFLRFESVDALTGSFWRQVSGEEVVDRLAALCKAEGISRVFGDQRESFMLSAAFEKRELQYTSIAWTNALKVQSVELVRRWLRENQISLPDHKQLRTELNAFEERITSSGALTFAGRGAHDDFVALLLTAAMANVSGDLRPVSDGGDGWNRNFKPMPRSWPYIGGRGRYA